MIWFVFLNIFSRKVDCRRQRGRTARKIWHQSRCKTMVDAVKATRSEKISMRCSKETRKDTD